MPQPLPHIYSGYHVIILISNEFIGFLTENMQHPEDSNDIIIGINWNRLTFSIILLRFAGDNRLLNSKSSYLQQHPKRPNETNKMEITKDTFQDSYYILTYILLYSLSSTIYF